MKERILLQVIRSLFAHTPVSEYARFSAIYNDLSKYVDDQGKISEEEYEISRVIMNEVLHCIDVASSSGGK